MCMSETGNMHRAVSEILWEMIKMLFKSCAKD
jgi:hypothetical protein